MLTRTSRRSLLSIQQARRLSNSANGPTAPHRKVPQAAIGKITAETAKRPQSTVATATQDRPVPSPAFNREDTRYNDVQPLRSKEPELDHSFVGMNGGEIFHEMMLRHNVKHICMFSDFYPLCDDSS
jgi:acetolactate synthase-1/2/3 large subunit